MSARLLSNVGPETFHMIAVVRPFSLGSTFAGVPSGTKPSRRAGWKRHTIWQYTSSGSVPGIPGRVDLNRLADGVTLRTITAGRVVEAVRDEKLTPIEGISILACTTGQLLGYQAFHGQPQPAELLPYFFSGR